MRLILNALMIIIAGSWLPFRLMHPDTASQYWWEFSLAVLIIAILDFVIDLWNHRRGRA